MKRLYVKKEHGFTLVEIIVVLVILAILAAFTIPTYLGFISKTYEAELAQNENILMNYIRMFDSSSPLPRSGSNSQGTLKDILEDKIKDEIVNPINHSSLILSSLQTQYKDDAAIVTVARTTTNMRQVNLNSQYPFNNTTNKEKLNGALFITICSDGYLFYYLYNGDAHNIKYYTYLV